MIDVSYLKKCVSHFNDHINIVSFADQNKIKCIERVQNGFKFGEITWCEIDKLYMWPLKCDTKFLRKGTFITNVERRAQLGFWFVNNILGIS